MGTRRTTRACQRLGRSGTLDRHSTRREPVERRRRTGSMETTEPCGVVPVRANVDRDQETLESHREPRRVVRDHPNGGDLLTGGLCGVLRVGGIHRGTGRANDPHRGRQTPVPEATNVGSVPVSPPARCLTGVAVCPECGEPPHRHPRCAPRRVTGAPCASVPNVTARSCSPPMATRARTGGASTAGSPLRQPCHTVPPDRPYRRPALRGICVAWFPGGAATRLTVALQPLRCLVSGGEGLEPPRPCGH